MILAFYQCLCQAERVTETTCMYKSFSVLNARLENYESVVGGVQVACLMLKTGGTSEFSLFPPKGGKSEATSNHSTT